jgi:DNA topoisomerase VI subunit B
MIVSEKNVSDALSYLAIDPHPIALARKDVTDAENEARSIFASQFLKAGGSSVAAKEAEVNADAYYFAAKEREAEAILDLERHKARVKAAEMLIEVWRSENANVRAAERVR